MVFLAFFGHLQRRPAGRSGWALNVPLIVLAALAIAGGFVELPSTLGGKPYFSDFLQFVLPAAVNLPARATDVVRLQVVAGVVSLAGIYLAWLLFLRRRTVLASAMRSPALRALDRFWFAGWGFDRLYDVVFVRPLVWFATVDKSDGIDRIYDGLAWSARTAWRALSHTETGRVRWYAAGITVGALVITTIVIFL